jgi:ATP-dependent Clp protease ATP-binding subunit ClpA
MHPSMTEHTYRVLRLAEQQTQRFCHEYVGTEHVLLGVVIEGRGIAAHALRHLGLNLHVIRLEVEKTIQPGPDTVMIGRLPWTPRTRKAIEYAFEEARNHNHGTLNTGHLLLGLLRERQGVAAQILNRRGVRADEVRAVILAVAGSSGGPEPLEASPAGHGEPEPREPEIRDLPLSVRRELADLSGRIEQLNQGKEAAILDQNFEKAAHLRDQADKLRRAQSTLIWGWRTRYAIEPGWLSWQGSVVGRIAAQIHDEQRWHDLPVLADALEEAGCCNQEILDHCRQPGLHGGRCWVVDLVLGEL